MTSFVGLSAYTLAITGESLTIGPHTATDKIPLWLRLCFYYTPILVQIIPIAVYIIAFIHATSIQFKILEQISNIVIVLVKGIKFSMT